MTNDTVSKLVNTIIALIGVALLVVATYRITKINLVGCVPGRKVNCLTNNGNDIGYKICDEDGWWGECRQFEKD